MKLKGTIFLQKEGDLTISNTVDYCYRIMKARTSQVYHDILIFSLSLNRSIITYNLSVMVNIVDIIASLVVAIVVLAVSFYLFAMYCHRKSAITQPRRKDLEMHCFLKY